MVEKLELALAARGWTQSALEKAAMLSENRISKWKNGKGEPTARQALRISRLLELPLEYLVDDDQDEPAGVAATERERQIWEIVRAIGEEQAWLRLVGSVHAGPEPRLLPPPTPRTNSKGQAG